MNMNMNMNMKMKMKMKTMTVLSAALFATAAYAQERGLVEAYPTKPIRFIVPYAPGGMTTVLARTIGQKLTERWNQQIIVDNRPGANGVIGAEQAARAPGDGYTLFLGNTSILTINPVLYAKLPYNAEKDFLPVNCTVAAPLVLGVHPSIPVKNVAELVKLAKTRPGQLTFTSAGSGGVAHLAGELLNHMTGIQMTHVPHKGAAGAVLDAVAGQTTMTFMSAVAVVPQVRAGKLRALGVTSAKRAPLLPDIASIAETVPGYDASPWYGVVVPAATPRAIVMKLHEEIARMVTQPDVAKILTSDGGTIVNAGPEEFARILQQDRARWARVVKAANIKLD